REIDMTQPLPLAVASAATVPHVGLRYWYDTVTQRPARNDLIAEFGGNRETTPVWEGEGQIRFHDAENEEVQPFAPRRMVGAWWYSSRSGPRQPGAPRTGPKILHEYGNTHPYANRPRIRALLDLEGTRGAQ